MAQRVAIYARVSTDDQDCTRQVEELTAWAARQGAFIVGTYQETGSGAKADRAARKCVLDLCRKRLVDAVLVSEASRWSRSLPDLLATLEDMAACKVSLRAMNGLDMDLSSATGRLMAGMLGLIAEFERGLLRERIASGMAAARRKGVKLGGHRGERKVETRKSDVLALTQAGKSVRQIASELNLSPATVQKIRKAELSENSMRSGTKRDPAESV